MGVMTTSRKRPEECMNFNHFHPNNSPSPTSIPSVSHRKRPRLSSSTPITRPISSLTTTTTTTTGSRISRYPEPKQPLRREVHAPCRPKKFDLLSSPVAAESPSSGARVTGNSRKKEEEVGDDMGNFLMRNYRIAKHAALDFLEKGKKEEKEVVELDSDGQRYEEVSEDSSVEEVRNVGIGVEGRSLVTDQRWRGNDVVEVQEDMEFVDAKAVDGGKSTLTVDSGLTDSGLKVVNDAGKGLESLALIPERDLADVNVYRKLLEGVGRRDDRIKWLDFQIKLHERHRAGYESLRPKKEPVEEAPCEPFVALTKEEEDEVESAFKADRRQILVTHEDSNIEISGEKFRCLMRGAWLNDEVINLYLELLKEREKREPWKFLKCHFFNTFFYKKLISGRNGYDFKSVRRWTSQRKLGYGLIECDKIFVPIHKEIHWCLAVINKKDQKFQYLDSLKGMDNHVLKVLARYFVDEVKDKTGKDIDVSSWEKEFVEDLPEQENGFDCGVFMIKYADFYSRGLGLCFNQEHMPYFRLRTAKEILRLRAD